MQWGTEQVHSRHAVHSRYAVCSRCYCKKVNSHSGFSKYGWWGLSPLVQKGQTHTVGYSVGTQYAVGMQQVLVQKGQLTQWIQQIWVVGTITFSAKRSNPMQWGMQQVLVQKKVNSHSGLSKYGWWRPLPVVQKGQTHTVGCTVGTQNAVGVSAKRSIRTVDLANMGGGDHYLQSKKVKTPCSWYAVYIRCQCKKVNWHSGVCSSCAVCSMYTVRSRCQYKKGQPTQWTQQIWVVGTVTFSAKRSNLMPWGMQYGVGVGAKRSTHTVDLANIGGGEHYFQFKKVKPLQWGTQYAVGMQLVLVQKGQLTQWTKY